jgi:putative exosortase-associated protein (TIGR04073 family)
VENLFTNLWFGLKWGNSHKFMRNTLFFLGSVALVALLGVGCTGPEHKLGRGFANATEVVRMGELNRSVEQNGLFLGTDVGVATGMVEGFDRTMARTGLGIYEIVTFPIPPYHPIWTSYLAAQPEYPDAYAPSKYDISTFNTDVNLGFSGGDIAPWVPGSRFRVFNN